ncbi:MAG: VCBS repeat-containing protein [Actinomycetota bacterium]
MRRGIWFGIVGAAIALVVILWPEDTADDATVIDLPGESAEPTVTSPSTTTTTTTSTSTSTSTTTEPPPTDPVVCPEPPDLADAVHIAPDRTPLDVDQDGAPDEVLWIDVEPVTLVVRFATGAVVSGPTGTPFPSLVSRPEGGAAAADLDGDGDLEFFVGGYGNTGRSAALFTVDGCAIERVVYDGEPADDPFAGLILIGVGGNSCSPSGCWPRVTCRDDGLVTEVIGPTEEWRGVIDADPALVEMGWETRTYRLVDGRLTETSATTDTILMSDVGTGGAPATDDSDVIDCGGAGGTSRGGARRSGLASWEHGHHRTPRRI